LTATKRKCTIVDIVERRLIIVDMTIEVTMLRVCVLIATIATEESKGHGTALTKNYMPLVCVKTAILTITIAKRGSKSAKFMMKLEKRAKMLN
jgi:hypothetical protein